MTGTGSRLYRCPKCGGPVDVTDSRPTTFMGTFSIRRRRDCGCGYRFTTFEVQATFIDEHMAKVETVAKDGVMAMEEQLKKLKEIAYARRPHG